MNLSRIHRDTLLNLPLKEVAIGLSLSAISGEIQDLFRELGKKSLPFRPHIWISDDWFCPDGQPGFAVPFYVLHPRLTCLMEEYGLDVEGKSQTMKMKILRHETGHAVDNAYGLRRLKSRQKLFGLSSAPYPESYEPLAYSQQYVKYLSPHYAQAHPDEDWAETFAVWLDPSANWPKKYPSGKAREKLDFVHATLKACRTQRVVKTTHREIDAISKNTETFASWLNEKQNQQHCKGQLNIDRALRKIFSISHHRKTTASAFIRQAKPELARYVAARTGFKQYEISFLLQNLQKRSARLKLVLQKSEAESFSSLYRHLMENASCYIKDGVHRIRM